MIVLRHNIELDNLAQAWVFFFSATVCFHLRLKIHFSGLQPCWPKFYQISSWFNIMPDAMVLQAPEETKNISLDPANKHKSRAWFGMVLNSGHMVRVAKHGMKDLLPASCTQRWKVTSS